MSPDFASDDQPDARIHREPLDVLRQLAQAQAIAHIGSWEWDVPANTVTWSDELFRIYGLEPDTFLASYEAFLELVHPDDREFVSTEINSAYSGHEPFSFLHRIVRPDGEIRTLRARGEVFADDEGNILRMSGTGQDVTEQMQLEEDRRRFAEVERRHKQALQLNDEIVQGLSAVKMAQDLGLKDKADEAVVETLRNARAIVSRLLEDLHEGGIAPGDLIREDPSRSR